MNPASFNPGFLHGIRSPSLWLGVLAILVMAGAGPAAAEEEEEAEPAPQAVYEPLGSDLTVNLNGPHYLRVGIQIMSRDPATVEDVKHHQAALRNAMLMLLSGQNYKQLKSVDAQQKLRGEALDAAREALAGVSANNELEGLYFTRFVME